MMTFLRAEELEMTPLSRHPAGTRPQSLANPRAGFTLLELMIVIVIIALLVGLVLPAIMSARGRARDAEVRKDISDLEQAITQFKVVYGIEPPSAITLYANPTAWDARSRGLIRQMWPQFNFGNCGGASSPMTMVFTGIPGNPATIELNGAECLVFFLGGVVDGNSGAFVGFAKDPTQPFAPANIITNREGPFFEFRGAMRVPLAATPVAGNANWAGRLRDLDADWFPEYLDPLPQQVNPYVYFSTGGGAYRTEAIMGTPNWRNTDGRYGGFILMNYAYYTGFNAMNVRASVAYNPRGIQIISPGADGEYGNGGWFNPDRNAAAPAGAVVVGQADMDNITNFHPGRLQNN